MGEFIKAEDFQDAGETLAARGSEDGHLRLEGLRIVSHALQPKSPQGTVVTVRDLINLPNEVRVPPLSLAASGLP